MIKRLHFYLSRTDHKTTTYRYNVTVDGRSVQKDLYDGECRVIYAGRPDKSTPRREPAYWQNGIAYTLERTNKLALDRPTVTIAIPVSMLKIAHLTPAAADYCLRAIKPYFEVINRQYANISRPDKDNGKFYIYDPGSTVLLRNTAYFAMQRAKDYEDMKGNTILYNPDIAPPPDIRCLCIRMEVQLPFQKRDRAIAMLCKQMPDAAERFVNEFEKANMAGLLSAVKLEETQQTIRRQLHKLGYCAFIANGSILARERGTDNPQKNALPFQSPPEHEIEISGVRGMGIKHGISVITGGGYSGKSTVLNAVSAGIYNHTEGDGRELCITDPSAVTITAEDGRAVHNINISPFIKWIPGSDPANFSTTHASGSTSQGANIMEAIASGAKLLLIDEDRSATNFMIRDSVMKALIEKEPITPFTDRVRELKNKGVSTILVIGGSGEYLSVADSIYVMDEFVMSDATEYAKSLAPPASAPPPPAGWDTPPLMITSGFTSYPAGKGRELLSISDTGFIAIGDERIDIRSLHDIATPAQINAIAFILRYLTKERPKTAEGSMDDLEALARAMRGLAPKERDVSINIAATVESLFAKIEEEELNLVDTGFFPAMERFMDMPRPFEVMAAIRRMHCNFHTYRIQ